MSTSLLALALAQSAAARIPFTAQFEEEATF